MTVAHGSIGVDGCGEKARNPELHAGAEKCEARAGHDAAAVADLRWGEHWTHVAHRAHYAAARLHERRGKVSAENGVDHGRESGRCIVTAAAGNRAPAGELKAAVAAPQTRDAGLQAGVRATEPPHNANCDGPRTLTCSVCPAQSRFTPRINAAAAAEAAAAAARSAALSDSPTYIPPPPSRSTSDDSIGIEMSGVEGGWGGYNSDAAGER